MPKLKTKKGVSKRMQLTKTGKVKRRKAFAGHQTGEPAADDQGIHDASMSTRASQIRIASTITPTTPVTIRVVISSR